jgi:hypothetical protein
MGLAVGCLPLRAQGWDDESGEAPAPDSGEAIIFDFERRFAELDSLIFPRRTEGATHFDGDDFNAGAGWANEPLQVNPSPAGKAIDRRVSTRIAALNGATGLEITGQVYSRIDDQLGLSDEDDATSRYAAKAQAELKWYIFQSALWKHRGRKEAIRLQGQIEHLQQDKDVLMRLIAGQKEVFRVKSDSLLAGVLLHRIANLDLMAGAQSYLLRTENISSDDLLTILNEKAEAERLLATIPGDFAPAADLSHPSGVVVTVDTTALLRVVREGQVDLAVYDLRMRLLEQQRSNESYWATVNAAPFIRYSLYTRENMESSNNVDAGVSFRIPLSSEIGKKRRVLKADIEVLRAQQEHLREELAEKVQLILLEIARLNRSSIGEFRRMQELKNYLRQRSVGYHNRIGEYSRLARTREYNTYLLCWEKLISFQYRRDCYVADLQAFLPDDEWILYFCRETPLSELYKN